MSARRQSTNMKILIISAVVIVVAVMVLFVTNNPHSITNPDNHRSSSSNCLASDTTTYSHCPKTELHATKSLLHWKRLHQNAPAYAVSCFQRNGCMAVSRTGNSYRWNGTTWSAPLQVEKYGLLSPSISCSSSIYCIVSDNNGMVFQWNGYHWRQIGLPATRGISFSQATLNIVSCAGTDFCMISFAILFSDIIYRIDGTRVTEVATLPQMIISLSCASSRYCMFVELNGTVLRWNGTQLVSNATPVGISLDAVYCVSSYFCIGTATSSYGTKYSIYSWNGLSWKVVPGAVRSMITAEDLSTGVDIGSHGRFVLSRLLSCVSVSDCLIVSFSALYRFNGYTVTPVVSPHVSHKDLSLSYAGGSVSCTNRNYCMYIGDARVSYVGY